MWQTFCRVLFSANSILCSLVQTALVINFILRCNHINKFESKFISSKNKPKTQQLLLQLLQRLFSPSKTLQLIRQQACLQRESFLTMTPPTISAIFPAQTVKRVKLLFCANNFPFRFLTSACHPLLLFHFSTFARKVLRLHLSTAAFGINVFCSWNNNFW